MAGIYSETDGYVSGTGFAFSVDRSLYAERSGGRVCKIFHIAATYRTAGHPDDAYFEVKTARWCFENGHLNGLRRQAVS